MQIAGNEEMGLESLSGVKQKDAERAEKLVKRGKSAGNTSGIFLVENLLEVG